MKLRKLALAFFLTLILVPAVGYAQEKNGTITRYDAESRMVTIKGKDWEQTVKVRSSLAKEKADLLKEGTKVKVEFDVGIKSLSPR